VNCPGCARQNEDGRRFCGGCGIALRAPCRRCGFANLPIDLFCGGCGDAIASAVQAAPPRVPMAVVHASPMPPPATQPRQPARRKDEIAAAELQELLEHNAPAAGGSVSALPARVSQDDLDRLFGSGR